MGLYKNIYIVLENEFPNEKEEDSYYKLFQEFYDWLFDLDRNEIFVVSDRIGYFLDLCNDKAVTMDEVCEYWCQHIKKGIHNGEGFVINENDIR